MFLSKGKRLYCSFIDFRKAFDYISHDCLWYKMIASGITGNMFRIIEGMYKDIKSRVKVNNDVSEPFQCYLGVRQGESLSPFLFSLFLNDLESNMLNKGADPICIEEINIFLLLYADDCVILSETGKGLQQGLDLLYDYCTKWRLTVNTDKTKVVIFRKGGQPGADDHYFYGEMLLENVDYFCYLGIIFSFTGKWSKAQLTLADQGSKALFSLYKHIHHLFDPDPKFVSDLFDKLVLPVLMYACEAWGFHKAVAIERVHTNFCKKILHLRRTTSNSIVYGLLGRTPLRVLRLYRIIKYWLKIVMHKPNKLVYKMYVVQYRQAEGGDNWAGLVKQLLCSLGFNDVWLAQGVTNVNAFLKLCRQRIKDQYIQEWNGDLNSMSETVLFRQCRKSLNIVII